MKLSAAGGNWLVGDVSREGAHWLAETGLLWSDDTNSRRESVKMIGSGVTGAGHASDFFGGGV